MEILGPLRIFRRKIMAPCQPNGVVNSVWKPENDSPDEALYLVADDENKGSECRCPLGRCCVDGGNYVIDGVAFNLQENDK